MLSRSPTRQNWRATGPVFIVFALVIANLIGIGATSTATAGTLQSWFGGPSSNPAKPVVYQPTRFIIGLAKRTEFQVFSLSKPNRVVVELPNVKLQLPERNSANTSGLVKSFRGGRSAPGKSRVVIDVQAPVVVEGARLEKVSNGRGYRLSLDIVPIEPAVKTAQKPKRPSFTMKPYGLGASGLVQPPLPKPAVHPDKRAASSFKPTIVIDPGHGGRDTGAKKYGTVEKNVVLKFALKLRDALQATGRYRVLMTRDRDVFITLDGRRRYAEKQNAHLFIAVHADYASTNARGATIYSLRRATAKRLKSSARREVARDVLTDEEISTVRAASGSVSTVQKILADLARREVEVNSARTSMFARSVIEYMGDSTKLRSHPDKSAGFRVLKTAKFPSVLIELAYVSNRQDAALLRSDAWRTKVAKSITTAVDNYFASHEARLPL